jgi:TATA-binding protein-associated factor
MFSNDRLQKFKLNISSAIINNENAGIASMGTDQIIDLFSLEGKGDEESKKKESTSTGKVGAKDVLEGLDQLWDEKEYDDLQVDDFLKNIQSRRK